jgi:predicted nucleic acid-binding protein
VRLYLDSSLLVKLYVPEADSGRLVAGLRRISARLVITRFQFLEVVNAINRRGFGDTLDVAQVAAARSAISRDRALGLHMADTPVDMHAVLGGAIRLSDEWTRELGGRTLDLIHLAIARELGVNDFATADRRQADVARAAGFNPIDLIGSE